ncbi:N,N-dimethylformamidase beta subunit family domain-containing protein [Reyranella sp.]|uniref:N,N-dimethylformamidase beta subunit family domain-containing protein n=1 Tax=Reyranella sp. TaxID=1929291 RepID=UPI002F928E66
MTAPLTGYADRISARVGEKIAFKVSSVGPEPYHVRLVRIVRGDPNPAGPPPRLEDLSHYFAERFPSREQRAWPGSYALIDRAATLKPFAALSLEALIWPTLPQDGPQTVISRRDPATGAGFSLLVTADGMALEVGDAKVIVGKSLRARTWYRVWADADPTTGVLRVGQQPLRRSHAVEDEGTATMMAPTPLALDAGQPIVIAAELAADRPVHRCFNGKIEAPSMTGVAEWDLARRMDTIEIEDTGPNDLHGRLVNLPTRAMKGAGWTGVERDWRRAPHHYAAIHFHDDDLHDCGWSDDFTFTVPEGLKSGIYGMALACGPHRDTIPFFVLPARGKPQAKVCYLAATFTYQAYGNHRRGLFDAAFRQRVADWNAFAHNPDEHADYGLSTYNLHRDGSGTACASLLRPLLTWRPDYLYFNDDMGSGVRHLPADTHLTGWLDRMGIAFDVVTDHDLDREGEGLLAPYKVVLTGSHPEYHTERTLDGLQRYADGGGRLMYLGGNGFYWRVALSEKVPGALEVRRTEGGIRTWAAEAGEYHHALDGAYGGLWRRSDRPPNLLCGVGFSSQGTFIGSSYRRAPASRDGRHAWMFDGVKNDPFGGFGLSGGGAAGFEIDRFDPQLGGPPNTVVLASSEGHERKDYVVVHEERLGFTTTISGQTLEQLIRADMVYIEKPAGGAVFSVGSITYCGSLPVNDFDNDISRLTFNVVNRLGELGVSWPFPAKA